MNEANLHEVDAAVSRFIQKASKKNEPLEAFREEESFSQFVDKVEAGIMKQAKWLGKNLDQIDFLKDENLTQSEFEAKLGGWLSNEMPLLNNYLSQEKIYAYLYNAFVFSVEASYSRLGVIQKASGFVEFELTNQYYIAALKDQANYLLHKSQIDETTRKRMITLIRDSRLNLDTLDELATMIEAEFEGISATRAFMIANTETNQAMSTAQDAFLRENGFKTKKWVAAGPNTCAICEGNAEDGPVPLDQAFTSGDMTPPGHPGCECYEDAGEEIDLDSIPVFWDGSDNTFSRAWAAERKANQLKDEVEHTMKAELKKSRQETREEVNKIKENVDKLSSEVNSTIAKDREIAKADLQAAVANLQKSLKPEHKTVIQKAEVPQEVIDVINMLAGLATAPDPKPALVLSDFKPHDEDEGDIDYFGYVHPSGAWFIMEQIDDRQRYAAGTEKYNAAWDKRSDLKYKYIYEAFEGIL